MPARPKIVAFAGSLRRESFNRQLIEIACELAQDAGAEVTAVDLADYRLPVFDQDLETAEGPPETAKALKQLMIASDALLIASPEYNSSVTGVLKNTIDWVSRPSENEPMLAAFRGKVAAIVAASPGALGGLRGLTHLREILGNLGMLVLPDQLAVAQAHQAFDQAGRLADQKQSARLEQIVGRLVEVAGQLATK